MINPKAGFHLQNYSTYTERNNFQRSWGPSVSGGQNACYEIHIDEDLEELQRKLLVQVSWEKSMKSKHNTVWTLGMILMGF